VGKPVDDAAIGWLRLGSSTCRKTLHGCSSISGRASREHAVCRLRRWNRGVEVDFGLDLADETTAGRENAAASCGKRALQADGRAAMCGLDGLNWGIQ